MQTENNPWILIRLIMTLVCIFLLWVIFSFPTRFPGWTLGPGAYLLAVGCGIALVTFTGLILRDLPKIPGYITIGKRISPFSIGAPRQESTFTPSCHQCPGKSGVN